MDTPSVKKTLLYVYEGQKRLTELFGASREIMLSEIAPPPGGLLSTSELAGIHYELLFGNESQAQKLLLEFGIETSDIDAYKLQADVRMDAFQVMQLMTTQGLVTLSQWKNKNWNGPDRKVSLVKTSPFMVLALDNDSTVAVQSIKALYPEIVFQVILQGERDGLPYEIERHALQDVVTSMPFASAEAQFNVENKLRFEG